MKDQSCDSASPPSTAMKRETSVAITSAFAPGDACDNTKLIAICSPATRPWSIWFALVITPTFA